MKILFFLITVLFFSISCSTIFGNTESHIDKEFLVKFKSDVSLEEQMRLIKENGGIIKDKVSVNLWHISAPEFNVNSAIEGFKKLKQVEFVEPVYKRYPLIK